MGSENTQAMRGGGFYNENSQLQLTMLETAIDVLKKTVERLPVDRAFLALADFGASQGKNSVIALAEAIRELRKRAPALAVSCTLNDLPSNDWNTVAALLSSADCAFAALGNVQSFLAPRSFYEQVLPPASLDCGFSFTALHWMRRVPVELPSAFYPGDLPPDEFKAFGEQAAADWELFLRARRAELRPGGRLCLLFPATREDGASCLRDWVRPYDRALRAANERGAITREERARATHPVYFRTGEEIRRPFEAGAVAGLRLEHLSFATVTSAPFRQLQAGAMPRPHFAAVAVQGWRAINDPTLAAALEPHLGKQAARAAMDQIAAEHEALILAGDPSLDVMESIVARVVVVRDPDP